jgi:hypothetical protein
MRGWVGPRARLDTDEKFIQIVIEKKLRGKEPLPKP